MSYNYFKRVVALAFLAIMASCALISCRNGRPSDAPDAGSVDSLTFARGLKITHNNELTFVT